MSDNYQQAVADLEAALGWETLSAQGDDDFQIKDIWGIFSFLKTSQSYYFVGSRGAGKSVIVTQAVRLLGGDKRTLLCVLDGESFKSIGEGAENETIKKFIVTLFSNLLDQIKRRKDEKYAQIAKISSIYAKVSEWADFRHAFQYLNNLKGKDGKNSSITSTVTSFAKSHLRLLLDVASLKFSLADTGIIKFGSIELTPMQLEFDATSKTNENTFEIDDLKQNLNSEIGPVETIITPLIDEIAQHCHEQNIKRIMVLCDDFHFLSVASQVRIIHFLMRVVGQLRRKKPEITMVLKIFSATNLSPYIKGVLAIGKKELEIKLIGSSLDDLETKRQAIENLLVIILRKSKWSDHEFRRLFRREIIDLLLLLSGGHPRRFLEICAKLIETTKGNYSNLYQDVMFSSAKVLNSYRKELPIQLGIDGDPRANEYQRIYESAMERLSESIIERNNPYLLIPHEMIDTNPNFSQWVDDAVALGDLLEIASVIRVNEIYFRLMCINPATIYYKNKNLQVRYLDIVEIQLNIKKTQQDESAFPQIWNVQS